MTNYFEIEKIWEIITKKYYLSTFYWIIEFYMKDCDLYLIWKTIYHKSYGKLISLLVVINLRKNVFRNFIMSTLIWKNWKKNNYNSILVIINLLFKMIYYEPVKRTINIISSEKIIINLIITNYDLSNFIISNKNTFFTSKFRLSLCYFLYIK